MQKLFIITMLAYFLCSELIHVKSSATLVNIREARDVNPSNAGVLVKNEKIDKIGEFI